MAETLIMDKDSVFAHLDKEFAEGGEVDGKDISGTFSLVYYVVRRFQLQGLKNHKGHHVGGVLMGELLGQWNGDRDFDDLPADLQYLRYSYVWAKEKERKFKGTRP